MASGYPCRVVLPHHHRRRFPAYPRIRTSTSADHCTSLHASHGRACHGRAAGSRASSSTTTTGQGGRCDCQCGQADDHDLSNDSVLHDFVPPFRWHVVDGRPPFRAPSARLDTCRMTHSATYRIEWRRSGGEKNRRAFLANRFETLAGAKCGTHPSAARSTPIGTAESVSPNCMLLVFATLKDAERHGAAKLTAHETQRSFTPPRAHRMTM